MSFFCGQSCCSAPLCPPTCPPGPQGPQGPSGSTVVGPQGPQGPASGPQGPQGPTGATGPQGTQGPTGATGSQGPQGPQGPFGPVGIQGPQGPAGPIGADGFQGTQGPQGPSGLVGPQGTQGPAGPTGAQGPQGTQGVTGAQGAQGPQGPAGLAGSQGVQGPQGPTTTPLGFGDFLALMPADNALVIAAGAAVTFPTDGPTFGGVARAGLDTFILPAIGSYVVMFQVSATGPGQLQLELNGVALPNSVAGRFAVNTQITGISIVTTVAINSTLRVINPLGNVPLSLTPSAGGALPASAHVTIIRLA